MKKKNPFLWWAGAVVLALIVLYLIQLIVSPRPTSVGSSNLPMLLAAFGIGMLLMFLIRKAYFSKDNSKKIIESTHTIVESIRKVFKVVTAEGQFNEIYNYEESGKIFGIIPTQKKALVIVTAKASFGYDFEKCKWEIDEHAKKIKLISFPPPEIISLDTDYQYYNIEENLLNKFSREDLGKIQTNGKKQVILAAKNSTLPQIAAEQMITLLTEILYSKEWKIDNINLIIESSKALPDSSPAD